MRLFPLMLRVWREEPFRGPNRMASRRPRANLCPNPAPPRSSMPSFIPGAVPRSSRNRANSTEDVMFDSGTARKLLLEVSGTHAKYVDKRFGHDLKLCHIDESDERNVIGYACVSVIPSPTFFRWLFGMGGAVRLAKPNGKRWIESFPNAVATDSESYIRIITQNLNSVNTP